MEIEVILTKIVGPKFAKVVNDLVVTLVNGLLGKVLLRSTLKVVLRFLVKLLKSHGILAKLLGGGNPDVANGGPKGPDGKLKNLTPADQERLIAILAGTVGPYAARTVVKLVATLVDGSLGKLPLNTVLRVVVKLSKTLLGGKGLVGGLLGLAWLACLVVY